MKRVLMAEMTAKEYHEALQETDTVILPVGSTEILGTHSPLGSDHLIAMTLGKRLGEEVGAIVAPTIPYGDAMELSAWPGTITVDSDVLKMLYLDVCKSLISHGLQRVFFFNTHLTNVRAAEYCGRELRRDGVLVAQVDWWRAAFSVCEGIIESKPEALPFGHGGEVTTSVMMSIRPDLGDLAQATKEACKPAWEFHRKYSVAGGGPFFTYPDFTDFCEYGGWGDPSLASKEKGDQIVDRAVAKMADFLREFMAQPLPEPLN
jgi:creatinine amidohydrolase